MFVEQLIAEDSRRRTAERRAERFDPERGLGCSGQRRRVFTPVPGLPSALVPVEMLDDPDYPAARLDALLWQRLRCRHDFEYWCVRCATVKDKLTGREIAFVLNRPQRRVAAEMETMRRGNRPIRLILLKARQWGGSTVVQLYMAWLQSCHCRNWHSLICAHIKDTARAIRGMYSNLIRNYPPDMWEGDVKPDFKSFESSSNTREIAGRGCRVTIGSSESQEAVRGCDYAMAHLSEVAFYRDSGAHSPVAFVRAVCGAIAVYPRTLIVMESTANGIGNYFHAEWLRCVEGRADKLAVFVPWYEIGIYRLPPPDPWALYTSLNDYERRLWDDFGLSLERIWWYRCKSSEYAEREQMQAEYPTTPDEAFINSGNNVFEVARVERLRENCSPGLVGDIGPDGRFVPDSTGRLKVWAQPEAGAEYIVAVDVGGRWRGADWSVAAVMRYGGDRDGRDEVVAQWRGHVDHDRLAQISIDLAEYYGHALLMVESNTLESRGSENMFVLERMREAYDNMYMRGAPDGGQSGGRVGFHTNQSTKAVLVSGLVEAVRDGLYVERDHDACNELLTYEFRDGQYAAKSGHHDDMLMTRAMALYALHRRRADEARCGRRQVASFGKYLKTAG